MGEWGEEHTIIVRPLCLWSPVFAAVFLAKFVFVPENCKILFRVGLILLTAYAGPPWYAHFVIVKYSESEQ